LSEGHRQPVAALRLPPANLRRPFGAKNAARAVLNIRNDTFHSHTMTRDQLLQLIDQGRAPGVILIGGDNEFLAGQAFSEVRDRIVAREPGIAIESFSETSDLGGILDAYRTMSLFGNRRLLIVPEVNAFVSKKELASLYEKAINDWTSAKTDRKRNSSLAKLLHLLGLAGVDVDSSDRTLSEALGVRELDPAVAAMLEVARETGKKATRGEGDASLLTEAVTRGGAPGSILLMKTEEIPFESATVKAIANAGSVVACNLSREEFGTALSRAIAELSGESGAGFDDRAVATLRGRLGIDRMLSDKFSKEIPDLRLAISEAERLATLVGRGGRVTAVIVERETALSAGGARYELTSLVAERKVTEAIAKLRDLVAQSRREDPKTPADIHVGKFLFTVADEIRQLIGILSWARIKGIDLKRGVPFNRFKETLADDLSAYLKESGLVKQKPHPFALHKRFEAARGQDEAVLLQALSDVAETEFQRKCGGYSAELGLEMAILSMRKG